MRRAIVTCLLVAVTSAGAATDSSAQACHESVYLGFAEAQRAWQVSLKNLIVSARPDYDELVSLSAELQLAMIDKNQARFMYLTTQKRWSDFGKRQAELEEELTSCVSG